MKLLIEQQDMILQNFKDTADATKADLAAAINEHITAVVNKNKLIPIVSGAKRKSCKKGDRCSSKAIRFTSINGCYCSDCGYVFPF